MLLNCASLQTCVHKERDQTERSWSLETKRRMRRLGLTVNPKTASILRLGMLLAAASVNSLDMMFQLHKYTMCSFQGCQIFLD